MFGHCVRDTRETVSFCLNAEEPNASVLDIGPNNNGLAPRSVRVFEDSEIVSLFPPQQDHRERASSNTIWGGGLDFGPFGRTALGGRFPDRPSNTFLTPSPRYYKIWSK